MAQSAAFDQSEVDNFLSWVNTQDFSKFHLSDFDAFQYEGFDPMTVIRKLMTTQKIQNLGKDEVGKDISFIVGISIIIGSPAEDKLDNRMSKDGAARLRALAKKWDINFGKAKQQPSTYLTFPRVALAFPAVTMKMMKVIGPKDFPNDMGSVDLPWYIKHPCFPSVIPANLGADAKRALMNASLCYGIDMTISLQALQGHDLKKIATDQFKFVKASNQSRVPGTQERLKIFKTLESQIDYKKIAAVLSIYKRLVNSDYEIPSEQAYKQSYLAIGVGV